jgi:GT2 family glycosyltransferase
MPVHNALPHLDEALESILTQTFADFEFIILDDASTDGSADRLSEWSRRDSRISLLHTKQNLGPVGSSNMVAAAAKADLVARMDSDDISYPDRLRQQMDVFDANPAACVVASLCDIIDDSGRILRSPEAWRISRRAPFVPFAHGAMMFRRTVFDRIGGYRDECVYWEDQDLVVRMATAGEVLVIPRSLYQVRAWAHSTRLSSDSVELEQAINRMYKATDRLRNQADGESPKDGGVKVDPRVFISLGSIALWAGGKPRLFRRLLRRGHLSANFRTATALVWTAWASFSPGSLRGFLRLLLVARNYLASRNVDSVHPITWSPGPGRSTD